MTPLPKCKALPKNFYILESEMKKTLPANREKQLKSSKTAAKSLAAREAPGLLKLRLNEM